MVGAKDRPFHSGLRQLLLDLIVPPPDRRP
jgi:hypothetical protein